MKSSSNHCTNNTDLIDFVWWSRKVVLPFLSFVAAFLRVSRRKYGTHPCPLLLAVNRAMQRQSVYQLGVVSVVLVLRFVECGCGKHPLCIYRSGDPWGLWSSDKMDRRTDGRESKPLFVNNGMDACTMTRWTRSQMDPRC